MKAYLLYDGRDFDFGASLPAWHEDLIRDLELGTLLRAMAGEDRFLADVTVKVLIASLDDPQAIRYRQRILRDCLDHPDVIRDMYKIATGAVEDKRHLWSSYGGPFQNASSNLAGAVSHLEAYVVRLRELRQLADDHAADFRSDGMRRLFGSLRRDLDDAYFEEISGHLRRLRFRTGVLTSARLGRDNSETGIVLRDSGGKRRPLSERLGIAPRTSYSFTVPPRDESGGQIVADLASRGLNLVANAAAQSADHIGGYFNMLRAELGFYVGCLNLADRLAAKEVPLAVPDPADPSSLTFRCTDLRDACLELASPAPVTGNDVRADGKPLVIITGANSGGKSTFLRSVGVAQLMMQCGLFVTAGSYHAGAASGVFTHFIREEDAGMISGRLDDELRRMSAAADRIAPHAVMLFNESFAGTNEREGAEIGYQVVRALLDAGVRVFFVSHRFDFTDRFRREHAPETVFLRAERGVAGHRDYKLTEKPPLPTSFGPDLYYRLGGWLEEDEPVPPAAGPTP